MTIPVDRLRAAAESLLRQAVGPDVRLGTGEALTIEQSVWRYVATTPTQRSSVIVRTHRRVGTWRTTPEYLLNEFAAAAFVDGRADGLVPKIIASDLDAGVVVTEDLGSGPSIAQVLTGNDAAAAQEAIVAYARALGELHAGTAGQEPEYRAFRASLGPTNPMHGRGCINERSMIDIIQDLIGRATDDLGNRAAAPVIGELHEIAQNLAEPGDLLALSSGDPCPYNCVVVDGRARLFDFELAGFRHPLLDVAYLHLGFSACYRSGRLPAAVLNTAEHAYRQAAERGLPQLHDGRSYRRHLATAQAAITVTAAAAVARAAERVTAQTVQTVRFGIAVLGTEEPYPNLLRWLCQSIPKRRTTARTSYQRSRHSTESNAPDPTRAARSRDLAA